MNRVLALAASGAGVVLAAATRTIAWLRPAAKPLHPDGDVARGQIRRSGSAHSSGVPWLDEVGTDDVLVRRSRAIGLPSALPDIHGLALRVLLPDGPVDLLLASTGWGVPGRFLLSFGREPGSRPLTTLLPYRTGAGPVVLGARALDPTRYALWWAPAIGRWHQFATLDLSDETSHDEGVSFDPMLRQLPGLPQYAAVVRLRERAYSDARRSRGQVGSTTATPSLPGQGLTRGS